MTRNLERRLQQLWDRTIVATAEPQFIEVRFMAPGGGVVSSMTVKIDQGVAPKQRWSITSSASGLSLHPLKT